MHKAIDIHGHFGNPERFPQSNLEKEMYRISLESLKKNYVQQGITAACISPMEGIFRTTQMRFWMQIVIWKSWQRNRIGFTSGLL